MIPVCQAPSESPPPGEVRLDWASPSAHTQVGMFSMSFLPSPGTSHPAFENVAKKTCAREPETVSVGKQGPSRP